MLNIRAEYQKATLNHRTSKLVPDGEPITVTIIDTFVGELDPCFIAVTGDNYYICDSISRFSGCTKGWLDW